MRVAFLDTGHELTSALAGELSGRGHDVVLSSPWAPPATKAARYWEDDIGSVPGVAWKLMRGQFDVAHAFVPACAWAATVARRFGGPPFVLSFRGALRREWLVDRHYRLEMLAAAAAAAACCSVDDTETAVAFRRYLLREPVALAAPLSAERVEPLYAECLGS